ncbi:MAG: hypothetical protein IT428_12645 [Planctomycetaceae bacterium]|nr:hypothetical protein [Planctomycetaceae bacterium]
MASRAFVLVLVTVGFAWVWNADQSKQAEILAMRKSRFPVIAHPRSQSRARLARVGRHQEVAKAPAAEQTVIDISETSPGLVPFPPDDILPIAPASFHSRLIIPYRPTTQSSVNRPVMPAQRTALEFRSSRLFLR